MKCLRQCAVNIVFLEEDAVLVMSHRNAFLDSRWPFPNREIALSPCFLLTNQSSTCLPPRNHEGSYKVSYSLQGQRLDSFFPAQLDDEVYQGFFGPLPKRVFAGIAIQVTESGRRLSAFQFYLMREHFACGCASACPIRSCWRAHRARRLAVLKKSEKGVAKGIPQCFEVTELDQRLHRIPPC